MRMFPRIAKKILVFGLITVAAAAIFAVRPCSSEPRVSVGFVGWVNNDPATAYARFAITNSGTSSIKPGSLVLEMPPTHFENASYRRPSDGFIRPGRVEVVTVLAPLEEGRWRLHLSFCVAGLHRSAASWYAGLFHRTRVYAVTPDAIRFDPDYEVQSDWNNSKRPNPAAPGNGAVTSRLHIRRLGRAVPEQHC